jgi:1-aminocyclopropane-1-carboxylate deaminase
VNEVSAAGSWSPSQSDSACARFIPADRQFFLPRRANKVGIIRVHARDAPRRAGSQLSNHASFDCDSPAKALNGMLEKFQRYPLTFSPTPIEKLSRLSAHLGGQVALYAKREDCNSGLAFGGNKLRKLEYVIPDAIASNADTLVSIGGVQSNHTRQVAAVAAKIAMKCRLVQEAGVPHEDAVYDRVGNITLSRIMGADVRLIDNGFDIGIRKSWEDALKDIEAQGGRPYAIPVGACINTAGSAMSAFRRRGTRAGARAWIFVRLCRRLHGDRLDGSLVSTLRGPIHVARSSLFSTQLVHTGHLPQTIRLRLDRVEHLLAERPNELLCVSRAQAADHP